MNKRWIDLTVNDNVVKFSNDFWTIINNDIDENTFWADEIKKYKDIPDKRLTIALQNLPLPAAFREAVSAIRSIVKNKKDKNLHLLEKEINSLYQLAAIYSFMLPYAENLGEPGFNVIESVPGNLLFNLDIDYQKIGYEKLDLLNKTDVKLIKEMWGEPIYHKTMNEIYNPIWLDYEKALINKRT